MAIKTVQARGIKIQPKHKRVIDLHMENPDWGWPKAYGAVYPKASVATCNHRAYQMMRKAECQQYQAEVQRALTERAGKTQGEVAAELVRVGFAKITDIINWDEAGNCTWTASADLTEAQVASIASVRAKQVKDKDGNIVTTIDFKMHDKLAALQQYIKLSGMNPEDPRNGTVVNNIIVLPAELPAEQQEKAMRVFDVAPDTADH